MKRLLLWPIPTFLSLFAPAPATAQADPTSLADCDAMIGERPERPLAYRCHWLIARRLENWPEASAHLKAVLARRPGSHHARLSLAYIEADRGNSVEAFVHFRRAWEGFAKDGDVRGEIYGRTGHAYVLMHQGGLEEAEAILRDGEAVSRRARDDMLLASVLVEQGVLGQRRGDFGWARNRFEEAQRLLDPSDPTFFFLRGRILTGLGEAARSMARHQEALVYFEERAAMLHEEGNHYQEMFSRYDIASTHDILWRQGEADRDTVLRLGEVALQGSIDYGNRWIEAGARILRARFLDVDTARSELIEASEDLLSLGHRELASRAFQHLAHNSLRNEDIEAAARDGARALALARESGDPVELALSYLTLAEIEWRVERGDTARRAWENALDAVEAIRDLQPDESVRARSFGDWSFAYYRFSSLLLHAFASSGRASDLEQAFAVGERRRSRVLLEQLDAAQATASLEPDRALAAERNALLARIVDAQRQLLGTELSQRERERRVRVLEELEREEVLVRDALARASARFAAVRRPTFPSLDEVRSELAPDEALLSFDLPGMRGPWGELPESSLHVVTRAGAWIVPLPSHEEIDPAVEMFLGLIQREDAAEVLGARRLFHLLLEDGLRRLPPEIRRLVIVPDGTLHRLPFAALAASPGDVRLFETFETEIVPSASAWWRWRGRRPEARPAAVLVLADPEPPRTSSSEDAAERGWALASGVALGTLPHAEAEGREVVKRLGEQRSVLRLGREASERFLKSADLSAFPVVHFAAHGILDETTPDRSAILLSPGDAAEDGLLQLRDIVGLELSEKLVVLAACKSASGEVLDGEGVLGLGRAFFQAGAQSVVGSLWTLGDREGKQAFEIFYASLARGESVASALRRTRKELKARGAPASAWAGLVALGDAGFAPVTPTRNVAWWPVALGLGVLGLVGARIAASFRRVRE